MSDKKQSFRIEIVGKIRSAFDVKADTEDEAIAVIEDMLRIGNVTFDQDDLDYYDVESLGETPPDEIQ